MLRPCLLEVLCVEVLDVLEAQQRKDSPIFSILHPAALKLKTSR